MEYSGHAFLLMQTSYYESLPVLTPTRMVLVAYDFK